MLNFVVRSQQMAIVIAIEDHPVGGTSRWPLNVLVMDVGVDMVVLFLRELLRKNKTNKLILLYLNEKFGLQWR